MAQIHSAIFLPKLGSCLVTRTKPNKVPNLKSYSFFNCPIKSLENPEIQFVRKWQIFPLIASRNAVDLSNLNGAICAQNHNSIGSLLANPPATLLFAASTQKNTPPNWVFWDFGKAAKFCQSTLVLMNVIFPRILTCPQDLLDCTNSQQHAGCNRDDF